MTTWQTVADRDRGDDPSKANIRVGDRYTLQDTGTADDPLIRIERPVPDTDEPQPGPGIADYERVYRIALQPPTREQIAALFRRWWDQQQTRTIVDDLGGADAVLALLQKEADR